MADLTLAWMISQLSPFLDFRPDYISYIHQQNIDYYASQNIPLRHWSTGKIYNSTNRIEVMAGSKVRTPGRYRQLSSSGIDRGRLLEGTQEYLHASVRIRIGLRGLGVEDKGPYRPRALDGWKCFSNGAEGGFKWVCDHSKVAGGKKLEMQEDELGEVELGLLMESPPAARYWRDQK